MFYGWENVISLQRIVINKCYEQTLTIDLSWMRELFKLADKDNNEELTLKEILNLLKHINISVDYDTAKQVFDVSILIKWSDLIS